VAILDADKEGFLRSERSLIQTCGRAARNVAGRVILYADVLTGSMKRAIDETNRRRKIQSDFNAEHNITPESIKKAVTDILASIYERDYYTVPTGLEEIEGWSGRIKDIPRTVKKLKAEMFREAKKLDFERAAELRDQIKYLEDLELNYR
jgi:excinuclease ABC subunit B